MKKIHLFHLVLALTLLTLAAPALAAPRSCSTSCTCTSSCSQLCSAGTRISNCFNDGICVGQCFAARTLSAKQNAALTAIFSAPPEVPATPALATVAR